MSEFTNKMKTQLGMVGKMYEAGNSITEIAAATKLTEETVKEWIEKYIKPTQNK